MKVLCPVPGYDRHFKVTESFGFELITIPMTENGPDMDIVENLIKDPSVKGMWNVPKYSNPDGIIYSDETIERIAKMKPAAPDFLLMWDNAYCIHEFDGEFVPFKDILSECEKYGNADMVFEFASTSKVTLPGAGIACFACSEANMEYMTKLIGIQAISFDKMNQLRHVKYLQNKEHTLALMKEHAKIMKPKFDMVVETLEREIAPLGIASWHTPKGGYFVSVNTAPGLAKRTLALAKEAGATVKRVHPNKLRLMTGTESHQGVAAFASEIEYVTVEDLLNVAREKGEPPFLVLSDGIEDPHNLGAVMRSALLCGAHGIVIPKRGGASVTPTVIKSSAGAAERLPVARVANIGETIRRLKDQGVFVYCADMDGVPLRKNNLTGPIALVLGSEGSGVSQLVKKLCDGVVRLDMATQGTGVDSFNVSVAAGIILYEIQSQRAAE